MKIINENDTKIKARQRDRKKKVFSNKTSKCHTQVCGKKIFSSFYRIFQLYFYIKIGQKKRPLGTYIHSIQNTLLYRRFLNANPLFFSLFLFLHRLLLNKEFDNIYKHKDVHH